ncbi:MAG: hypothetical protein ABI051_12310 [Vicinamibacterales bacterium]
MADSSGLGPRHQYRLVLCGHKAIEVGAVCVLLMVQGHLLDATLTHFAIAAKTGTLATLPLVGVTLTQFARHLASRWVSSALVGGFGVVADVISHGSHYPGAFTEALLTGFGVFVVSLVISYTPIGKRIDRLAETFAH